MAVRGFVYGHAGYICQWWVSAAGAILGEVFGAVARLKQDKPLHPRGTVYDAVLRRTGSPEPWGAEWLDTPGEDHGMVRVSRAIGLPRPLPDVLGLALTFSGAARRAVCMITKSVDVSVPVSMAYIQWTQFESFPEFMEGFEEVNQLDDTHLHWATKIAGSTREFDATITEQHPDERVAWKSDSGPNHAGVITFHRLGEGVIRATAQMDLDPTDSRKTSPTRPASSTGEPKQT